MYNYESYTKVKAAIEQRRQDAIAAAESRCELVRAESEEIAEIDRELSRTGLELFRIACAGQDLAPLKARNRELQARRRQLLVSLGYSEDFTDVHYTCEKCSDTGYTNKGQTVCSCLREALIKESIAASGIGRLINEQSFDNFDVEWYRRNPDNYDRMRANLAAAKNYVKSFKNKRGNLLLIGTTGTGKTHISTAIARDLIHQGYDVLYDSAENVFSDFEQDRFRSGYGPYEPKAEKYLRADLLIIDDLGTELTNQFTLSCLYNLLNTRHNRGLATVISTNLTPDQLEMRYEDRISSRLIGRDTQILVFVGDDHRIG